MFRRFLIFCVAFVSLVGIAGATPSIKRATIRFGLSPRMAANSWANLHYRVENPDAESAKIELVMRPQSQRNLTIYRTTFDLEAGYEYDFSTLITCGTVEKYEVDLFVNGHITETVEALIKIGDPSAGSVYLVGDGDLSNGSFNKNAGLHGKFLPSHAQARDLQSHWAGFHEAHIIVFMRPDFDQMMTRQFNAILDYVARGGTLFFADPIGLMSTCDTPLRKLLPVTPLRIRDIDVVDGFTAIDGDVVIWPEGTPFLESVPLEDGITTLWQEDFPLVTWRRYGLGYVGMCAINTSLDPMKHCSNFNHLYNHILSFGGNFSHASSRGSQELSSALDVLTGIEIPKTEGIRLFLIVYFFVVVVVIVIGVVVRQRMLSWVVMSGLAIVATCLIFYAAAQRSSGLSNQTAATLRFTAAGTEDGSDERLVSLFSKQEKQVTVFAESVDTRVRSLLPPRAKQATRRRREKAGVAPAKTKSYATYGKAEAVRDPISVSQVGGRAALNNLFLRQSSPQFYAALEAVDAEPWTSLPAVSWTESGPRMEPWRMPVEGPIYSVFIVCENGIIPVTHDGSNCLIDSSSSSMMAVAPEIKALQRHLSATAAPAPCLAVVMDAGKGVSELPEEFHLLGRQVHLVPVRQILSPTVTIPREQVRIEFDDFSARRLRTYGEWNKIQQRRKEERYIITAYLPPALNRLQVDSFTVYLRTNNPGRNITFDCMLKRLDDVEGADGLPAAHEKGSDAFAFTGINTAEFVEPASGRLQFIVVTRTVREIKEPIAVLRANTWQVQELKASAAGTLEERLTGTF
jgi:hypothetical protein